MTRDAYSLSAYQFDLPPELIAQHPCSPRDHSRLMVIERSSGQISEIVFHELLDLLNAKDQLVFNNTKVIPARLIGKRLQGGEAEIFLLRKHKGSDTIWEVLARPGKKLATGAKVIFNDSFTCEILEVLSDGSRIAQFNFQGDFEQNLQQYGKIPLPHYIRREGNKSTDQEIENYQTVFAEQSGAVAAPTAGLHFTRELLEKFTEKQIYQTFVTLHVGLGTFRPVQVDDIRQHVMHSEQIIVTPEAAERLNNRSPGGRQICVGTTCCRTLETASNEQGVVQAGSYDTSIFIYPGYRFKHMTALLTNFHLPGSSLLMLTAAFAGRELIMEAYAKAIERRFRFFSYGDAMLIL